MRAAVLSRFGPPSTVTVEQGWPKPARQRGHVLVQVQCSSVNPIDCKTRAGIFTRLLCPLPMVPGRDVAGVVLESDAGSVFPPGSRVWGFVAYPSPGRNRQLRLPASGAWAEQVSLPEEHLALMPASLSFEQAAGLPLVATTALQALEALQLQPGQRVLIHAGAGGVGSVAVPLAKARGLHVTTNCSTRNLAFVKQELGADEAVDYTQQQFEEALRGRPVDGVIDSIGGDYEGRSMQLLRRGGGFVSILAAGHVLGTAPVLWRLLKGKLLHLLGLRPRYHLEVVSPDGAQLAAIGQLVEQGKVRPVVDRVLPLERISEAMEYVEQGHTRGKVVVRILKAGTE